MQPTNLCNFKTSIMLEYLLDLGLKELLKKTKQHKTQAKNLIEEFFFHWDKTG